ncbi:toll/interleukin-1 receptor domain-containing protein [Actinomycetospora termitidis]|uniref:TIR domain-containing protein n=1 Tax=Actinomycetospora termitidis TaxID=3053470 RepID=A0ABT7MEH2_9PSEU|nr:TIR domain-containing protein [Actinomycetospora sp. Odt1-22]MDL5159050.1 TIR domain-containing protein [Actinomycetospora sp. Odt1-22]
MDAFISYSHAADRDLAPAIHQALERLGKPWYRRRARTVYLDAAGLEVTPKLWTTIQGVLLEARYLVLLCSPEAAASEWVDREIRFWLEHHGPESILVVVTSGTWVWDEQQGRLDVENSSAAPPALAEAFVEPPRYLDLTWARTSPDMTLRNGTFRDGVAALAAPISGRSKAELEGDDLREHRKTVRTAWGAAATLAILLVCALVAALLATVNAGEATRQRDVATSRLLATQSATRTDRDPQLSTLLALAASEVSPTPEATGAMMRMVEHDRSVVGYLGGHRGVIETAAVSPDGNTFLTAGPGDPVRLWDATTRTVRAELPSNTVSVAEFGPDGRSVAVGDGFGTTVWDPGTRSARTRIDRPAYDLAFSADGTRLVVGGYRGEVIVVDAATGAEMRRLPGLTRPTSGVGLSPDGRFVAAGDWSGTFLVWDLATGAEVARTTEYASMTKGKAAFAPDGRTLAASRNGGDVLVLDLASRAWQRVPAHQETITGLTYLDADTLVTASRDGWVGRWSIPTSSRWEQIVQGPVGTTSDVAVGPDGRTILTGDFTGNAVVWRMGDDWSRARGTVTAGTAGAAEPAAGRSAILSADGLTAEVVEGDRSMRVALPVQAASVSVGGGQLAVGYTNGAVGVFDVRDGTPLRLLRGLSTGSVVALQHSPDGRLLAVGDPAGGVVLYSSTDGTEYASIPPPSVGPETFELYTHLAFSADGRMLAHSSLNHGLKVWDVPSRSAVAELKGPSSIGTTSLAFAPDGRLAQGGMDGKIVIWDVARPTDPTAVLSGQQYAVTGLSFGSDNRLAAGSASGGGVSIWDVALGARDAVLRTNTELSSQPFFLSADSLLIVDSTGQHTYDLTPDAMRTRLCASRGRDLTRAEWSLFTNGREEASVCGQSPR